MANHDSGSEETRRSQAARREQQGPVLRPYRLDRGRLDSLDRRVLRHEVASLQKILLGAAPPGLPVATQPTTYDQPSPDDAPAVGREPPPFHQRWVVVALLIWATILLSIYIAGATWLRPSP